MHFYTVDLGNQLSGRWPRRRDSYNNHLDPVPTIEVREHGMPLLIDLDRKTISGVDPSAYLQLVLDKIGTSNNSTIMQITWMSLAGTTTR